MQIVLLSGSNGNFSYNGERVNITLLPDDIAYTGQGYLFQNIFSIRSAFDTIGLSKYVEPESVALLAAKNQKATEASAAYQLTLSSGILVGGNRFSASENYKQLFESLKAGISRGFITGQITVYDIDLQPLTYNAPAIDNGIDIYNEKIENLERIYKNTLSDIYSQTTLSGVSGVTW